MQPTPIGLRTNVVLRRPQSQICQSIGFGDAGAQRFIVPIIFDFWQSDFFGGNAVEQCLDKAVTGNIRLDDDVALAERTLPTIYNIPVTKLIAVRRQRHFGKIVKSGAAATPYARGIKREEALPMIANDDQDFAVIARKIRRKVFDFEASKPRGEVLAAD